MSESSFNKLYEIIQKLRSPEGCPWDREQTPATLRGALIEETYECIEAIDEANTAHIKEELGDLFLLVTMISYMHEEAGAFSVHEALDSVCEKLVRRHPHVFGTVRVRDSNEVLNNWKKIKIEAEGRAPKDSALDDVSRALPPLDRAFKLQKKAASAGFEWPALKSIFDKINEELGEVHAEIDAGGAQPTPELEGELGDLLFAVIDLCRALNIEPSVALQRTNTKFYERFKYVEGKMRGNGAAMARENLALMDSYWNEAKQCLLKQK